MWSQEKRETSIAFINNTENAPALLEIVCWPPNSNSPKEKTKLRLTFPIYSAPIKEKKSTDMGKAKVKLIIWKLEEAYNKRLASIISDNRVLSVIGSEPYLIKPFHKALNELKVNSTLLDIHPELEATENGCALIKDELLTCKLDIQFWGNQSNLAKKKNFDHDYLIHLECLNRRFACELIDVTVELGLVSPRAMREMLDAFGINLPYPRIEAIKVGSKEAWEIEKIRLEKILNGGQLNAEASSQIREQKIKVEKILGAQKKQIEIEKILKEKQLSAKQVSQLESEKVKLEAFVQKSFEEAFDRVFEEAFKTAKEAMSWSGGQEYLFELGQHLKEIHKFEEAIEVFKKIPEENARWEEVNLILFDLGGLKITMMERMKQEIEDEILNKKLSLNAMKKNCSEIEKAKTKIKEIINEIEKTREEQAVLLHHVPQSAQGLVKNWFSDFCGDPLGTQSDMDFKLNSVTIYNLCKKVKRLGQQLPEKTAKVLPTADQSISPSFIALHSRIQKLEEQVNILQEFLQEQLQNGNQASAKQTLKNEPHLIKQIKGLKVEQQIEILTKQLQKEDDQKLIERLEKLTEKTSELLGLQEVERKKKNDINEVDSVINSGAIGINMFNTRPLLTKTLEKPVQKKKTKNKKIGKLV